MARFRFWVCLVVCALVFVSVVSPPRPASAAPATVSDNTPQPGSEWQDPARWGLTLLDGQTLHVQQEFSPDLQLWVLLAEIRGPEPGQVELAMVAMGAIKYLGEPPVVAGGPRASGDPTKIIDWILELPKKVSDAIETIRDPKTRENYWWAQDQINLWGERNAERTEAEIVLTIGDVHYTRTHWIGERPMTEGMVADVAARIVPPGYTYTPARLVAQDLGGTVWYNEYMDGYVVRIRRNQLVIEVRVMHDGTVTATRNGVAIEMPAPPLKVETTDGRCCRLLMPARFVAEAMGATVYWDHTARQVIITYIPPEQEEVEW